MFQTVFQIISFIWLFLTGCIFWLVMYVFNKTTIVGKKNIVNCRNRIITPNHVTYLDSWLVTMALIWPSVFLKFRYHLLPYYLPDKRAYMKLFIVAIMKLWKCIFIHRGSGDFMDKADEIIQKLKAGSLVIFPEGIRTYQPEEAKIGKCGKGTALLAYHSKAIVLPIAIYGAHKILARGEKWWKVLLKIFFGKRQQIVIRISPPIKLEKLYELGNESEAVVKITKEMREKLQSLLTEAKQIYTQKA